MMWLVLEWIGAGFWNGSVTLAFSSTGASSGSILQRIASHFSILTNTQQMKAWASRIIVMIMIISMSILYPRRLRPFGLLLV